MQLPSHAQELPGATPISTERPALGASPDLVPSGSLQTETGLCLTFQRHNRVDDLPEDFLRAGLTGHVELRAQMPNVQLKRVAGGSSSSLSADSSISAKILIGKPNSFVPRSAIISLNLPTGSVGLTSGSYDPGLVSVWTQAFPHGYFLNEVGQVTWTSLNGARSAMWAPSISGGRAFSSRISGYVEYAPFLQSGSDFTYTVDGGVALAVSTHQQVDFKSGYIADLNGVHTLIGAGYSVRFDRYFHR